uniref:COP9 signalosome complex subunit 4 n=1 Tax=Spongospora subterranea TaxID=70186 RepID=A0A0H5RBG7_9EUKA|eukprot:CRZ05784.1 hypothetical protein [Spongospora subterranea]
MQLLIIPCSVRKLCAHTLSLMRNKIMYYGDDCLTLSVLQSEVHQAKEEYSQAAKILAEVDLDHISEVAARANLLLRITELYLADDDSVAASRYVLRAHRLIGQCANNTALLVRHKSSYAQVLDAERKFQDAALRYLSLSQMDCPDLISDTDQVIALQHAATCAILAGAGPSRSRVLALLYNDPRARALPNYAMLEAMHCNKIIGPEQQTQFRELLKPHQNADLAGGSTILQRAVLEHNMLAVSKLYQNISLSSLGKRLSISCEEAETVAALMIEQGRMHGIIDQVAQSIIFQDGEYWRIRRHFWDCYQMISIFP